MRSLQQKILLSVVGWSSALLIFFPIFWMVLTSFKTELEAIASTPSLFFTPTLENYEEILDRANYLQFAWNSVVVAFGSTFVALLLGIPAAYKMAFFPTERTHSVLLWMLSTKMLPAVGVLVPMYLMFRDFQLLDTLTGLVIVNTLINLPIVVWIIYTFFKDIPEEILKAARIDGAHVGQEILYILLPMSFPGVVSTALLAIILSWNEAFWSLNLTTSAAAPLTTFIASFSSPEGLFWAKLSAASSMAVAPIIIFGWMSQRQLVSGLTFGAVK